MKHMVIFSHLQSTIILSTHFLSMFIFSFYYRLYFQNVVLTLSGPFCFPCDMYEMDTSNCSARVVFTAFALTVVVKC